MRYVKFIVALCVFFIFIPVATAKGQKESDVVKKDGVYLLYANGIVKDTRTGLEWKAGSDKDTTWDEAQSWVQSLNLDGGGWRMPTINELERLYRKGTGSHNVTPLLKATSGKYLWVWSEKTKGSSDAWGVYFFDGNWYCVGRDGSRNGRAFAVRSRSDG